MKHSIFLQEIKVLAVCALFFPMLGSAKDQVPSGAAPFPSFIPFDASQGEFPEGVAVDKVGNVFVSIGASTGPRGAILKFTPSLEKSVLVDFGTPGALGLAVDAKGDVYVARAVAPNNGVYRVDPQGQAVRLPGTEQIVLPNALAFDQRGNLYISETFSFDPPLVPAPNGFAPAFGRGGIWRSPKGGGPAELWLRDELLTGLVPTLFPYPVGANGVAFHHGALFVINTDRALVVRIPVQSDGSAGIPEVWKQVQDVPESPFYQSPFFPLMLDGLALDVQGNIYIAIPSRCAIVRINADDLSQETVAVYPNDPLDAPLSLAFGTGKGERQNLFTSNGGLLGLFIPGLPWPGPGLVKTEVGVPGLPLP